MAELIITAPPAAEVQKSAEKPQGGATVEQPKRVGQAEQQLADRIDQDGNPDKVLGDIANQSQPVVEIEGANEEEQKYYQNLFETVDKIYAEQFPEIYQAGLIDRIKLERWHSRNGEAIPTTALACDPHNRYINFVIGTPITNADSALKDRVETAKGSVQRIIADADSLAHEYTHAIYESLSPTDPSQTAEIYSSKADATFNEGFAMMMQYLFIDAVKRNPQLLGLDPQGVTDLEHRRSSYLYSREAGLRATDQEYINGTLKVFHKIYAEAAGPPKTRNAHRGFEAMRTFVVGLNRTKTLQTDALDPNFQALVKAGNIDGLRIAFAR